MAYNVATENRAFVNVANGSGTVAIRYTGNAGETPIVIEYGQSLSTAPSSDYLRGIAIAQLNTLNTTATFINAQNAIPLPVVLDTTTPIPPVVSTFGQFVAASAPFTPGTTPTDVATIFGSATRTVTVLRVAITTIQTTAGINAWSLIKRSAANTGGTSAALTRVPVNATFPAATATVLQYTANPTGLGATVGNVWAGRIMAPALTSVIGSCLEIPLLASSMGVAPVVLTGTAQGLAINFGGAALPSGLSVQAVFWWTEQ